MFVEHCRCRSFQRQNAYPHCAFDLRHLFHNLETQMGLLGATETNHVNDRQWSESWQICSRAGKSALSGTLGKLILIIPGLG
jgi:hypothetical protein